MLLLFALMMLIIITEHGSKRSVAATDTNITTDAAVGCCGFTTVFFPAVGTTTNKDYIVSDEEMIAIK